MDFLKWDKNKNINITSFVLSIGTIFGVFGNFLFRYVGILNIEGQDYYKFSLILQAFQLCLFFPQQENFTREIRRKKHPEDFILNAFSISHWLTGLSGSLILFIVSYLILGKGNLIICILFSFSILFDSFVAYLMAITQAREKILLSSFITIYPKLLRGIFLIGLLLIDPNGINLKNMLMIYWLAYILGFIIASIVSTPLWKNLFQKMDRKTYTPYIKKNLKFSLANSINQILINVSYLLIKYVGNSILDADNYKIFDFAFFIISLTNVFALNFTSANVIRYETEDIPGKSKKNDTDLKFISIFFIIISLGVIIIDILFAMVEKILIFLNFSPSSDGIILIRMMMVIPISLFLRTSILGKVNSLGKYKKILIVSPIAFFIQLVILLFSYLNQNIFLLIFSILAQNLIIFILLKPHKIN